MAPVVIGLTGPTRSGKSWVAKEKRALEAAGTSAGVVGQDAYWVRAVQIKVDGRAVWSEEEPGCTDHAAFAEAIRRMGRERQVVIAEGFQLVRDPAVVQLLDSIYLFEIDHDVASRRRAAQGGTGRPNPNPQSPATFDQLTWPAHLRYLEECVDPLGERVRRLAGPRDATSVDAYVELIVGEMQAPGPSAAPVAPVAPVAPAAPAASAAPAALWPRDKLEWPTGGAAQVAVLVTTGALNPVHRGHAAMLHCAAARLPEAGFFVAGGYLSPSHDAYVQPKASSLRTIGLTAPFRLALAAAATASDALVSVGAWEARQPGRWPDFPQVCAALRTEVAGGSGGAPPRSVRVFYVCGSDHANKCGLWRGMGETGVVVVPRAAAASHPPGQTRPERPEANVFVARAAEGDAASFTSTRVREAVARRDHAAASAFLSPAAADLLLRPSRSEFALYEADYRAMRVPRPE